jgi:predicted alpha/beta hydrolase family esterase
MSAGCHIQSVRLSLEKNDVLNCHTQKGTQFNHLICQNNTFKLKKTVAYLYLFIEGDGLPWITPQRISLDPTPSNPLMLQLMSSINSPAVYLGRPCYFEQQYWDDQQLFDCHPIWWTHRRYAPEIVESMIQALKKKVLPEQKIIIIAHSGGATLALLMAQKLPSLIAIVTLAGNLDPERWTEHHHYSPMIGSLNPIKQKKLDTDIIQLHFIGENDSNIFLQDSQNFIQKKGGELISLLDIDHNCCWLDLWSNIQTILNQKIVEKNIKLEPNPKSKFVF